MHLVTDPPIWETTAFFEEIHQPHHHCPDDLARKSSVEKKQQLTDQEPSWGVEGKAATKGTSERAEGSNKGLKHGPGQTLEFPQGLSSQP